VKSLLTPQGVLAANTFSSSRLYEHESATYEAVFGKFFNLKRDNRVIITRLGALPDDARLRTTSEQFTSAFDTFGIRAAELLPLFTQARDWNPDARILTDQYSPANLLNLER
jgi:spermidine synthase